VVVSVWLYTLVFAFAALWFAHFALARLARLRSLPDAGAATAAPTSSSPSPPLLHSPESPPP
jgi:hypothetical protein